MTVTTDDLLDAIRDALAKPVAGDASTMAELKTATGYGHDKLRRLIRLVHAEGRLECVRVTRPTIIGTMATVPAYRIKPKAKAA